MSATLPTANAPSIPAPAAEEAGTFPVRRRRRTTRPAAGEPVTPDEAPAGE